MKPLEQRLDEQLNWYLTHVDAIYPRLLEQSSDAPAFLANLHEIEQEKSVFLHKQCFYFAHHDKFEYQLDETHYWLMRYRFATAWSMHNTLKDFPPGASTPAISQLCTDEEMMAWLLVPVWEGFGRQWFFLDQQVLFLRSKIVQ